MYICIYTYTGQRALITNTVLVFSPSFHKISLNYSCISFYRMGVPQFTSLMSCCCLQTGPTCFVVRALCDEHPGNKFFMLAWLLPHNKFWKCDCWVNVLTFYSFCQIFPKKFCQIFSRNFGPTCISSDRVWGNGLHQTITITIYTVFSTDHRPGPRRPRAGKKRAWGFSSYGRSRSLPVSTLVKGLLRRRKCLGVSTERSPAWLDSYISFFCELFIDVLNFFHRNIPFLPLNY